MKTLPLIIDSKGFTFRQIERRGNVALYSQHLKGRTGKPLAYEVIVIKSHNGYTIAGSYVEPAEMYPSDASFGTLGWSYSTLMKDSLNIALDKMGQVADSLDIKTAAKARKTKTT